MLCMFEHIPSGFGFCAAGMEFGFRTVAMMCSQGSKVLFLQLGAVDYHKRWIRGFANN